VTHPDARALFILLAARRLSQQSLYMWGGESHEEGGFDCSGTVSELCTELNRSFPGFYTGGRTTAAGIRNWYLAKGCDELIFGAGGLPGGTPPGSLVFFRLSGRSPHHVKVHLCTVPDTQLGAVKLPVGPIAMDSGGGGSQTTSPREALRSAAGIRLSASDQHGSAMGLVLDPFKLLDDLDP